MATALYAGRPAATPVPLGHTHLTSAFRYFDDGVLPYGSARFLGSPWNSSVSSPVVAMAANASGKGYWLATAGGAVLPYGNATSYGSLAGKDLASPVASMAATPDGKGYWLATAAGGVYAFGDAKNHGAHVESQVTSPIVQLVPTVDGNGYWLLLADGHVHAYGDAVYYGERSTTADVVGMARTADGKGYWLALSSGVVDHYGDAKPYGFTKGGDISSTWVTGIAADHSGDGFWLVGANGTVAAYGHAGYFGSNAARNPTEPDAGIVAAANGRGYLLLEPDAFDTTFTDPSGGTTLGRDVVAQAAARVYGDAEKGAWCNAYGPCEAWCALFATAVWQAAGIDIPRYAFTGDIYYWGQDYTKVTSPSTLPSPGWDVLYGSGPQSVNTSLHVGVVAQVWKDGFIDTVEGDAGPAKQGHYGVIINGPYLISQSDIYNDMPIYAFVKP
jgi:hypothetical protein